jgi:REP element-mobilizing transposase RayT
MARKPRLEFEGAIYHVINRENYRKNLFLERGAAPAFEEALLEACLKCQWKIHSYGMMSNHFHLAVETPEANLVRGMAAGELCQPLQAIPWQARTSVSKPLQKHPD